MSKNEGMELARGNIQVERIFQYKTPFMTIGGKKFTDSIKDIEWLESAVREKLEREKKKRPTK